MAIKAGLNIIQLLIWLSLINGFIESKVNRYKEHITNKLITIVKNKGFHLLIVLFL
jgi:hypothetical protein